MNLVPLLLVTVMTRPAAEVSMINCRMASATVSGLYGQIYNGASDSGTPEKDNITTHGWPYLEVPLYSVT